MPLCKGGHSEPLLLQRGQLRHQTHCSMGGGKEAAWEGMQIHKSDLVLWHIRKHSRSSPPPNLQVLAITCMSENLQGSTDKRHWIIAFRCCFPDFSIDSDLLRRKSFLFFRDRILQHLLSTIFNFVPLKILNLRGFPALNGRSWFDYSLKNLRRTSTAQKWLFKEPSN